jgi:hypothetical protein
MPHNAVAHGASSGDNVANNINDLNLGFFQLYDFDLSYDLVHAEVKCYNAGVDLEAILSGSLGQSKRGTIDEVLSVAKGDVPSMGMKGSVGFGSSPVSSGKPLDTSWTSPGKVKSNVSLSLIENSSDNMAVCPTMAEVIAFGGFS